MTVSTSLEILAAAALMFAPATGTASQDAWVDRLEIPHIFEMDFDVEVDSSAMGIPSGYDLGFGGSPEELVAGARERMEDGDGSARVLHELLWGLLRTGALQQEDMRYIEACLNRYDAEMRDAPEDIDKRMGFAHALGLTFRLTGVERFCDDALEQLTLAAELSPKDWRIHAERASLYHRRYSMGANNGKPEPEWLEASIEAAEAGLRASPKELGAHWCLFHTGAMAALAEDDGALKLKRYTELADVLAEGAAECEGGEVLALCGQAYCLAMYIPSLIQDEKKSEAVLDDELRARLTRFFENLEAAPEHPILARVAPAGWMLHALTHPVAEDAARLEIVVGAGMDEEWARATALVLHQRGGHVEGVAELAEALAEDAERDETRCALASYYHRVDADQRALDQIEALTELTPAQAAAHGILLLRTGEHERALDVLAGITDPPQEWPGFTEHALGVALALNERPEDAAAKLEEAVARLAEPDNARKTLDELRDM